jgi:peptidoglycan/LPS O-acetylase OafA/YrhL
MRHRDDIQGLRAVAVLLVVLAHAGVPFLKGGYVGVDVFFVLSGFLITGILLSGAAKRGYASLSTFYVRRARRILPAAALTLVATDIVAFYLLNFVRAREAVSDSIWAAFFAANARFAQQGTDYFAQGQPPSPLQHFWSLAVEEQFYLVWPGLLTAVFLGVGFRRRSTKGEWRADEQGKRRLLVVIIALSAASLIWSVVYTKVTPTAAYFSTAARVWELGLGAALAIAMPSVPRLPAVLRSLFGWLGVICIGCAAVLFSDGTPFPGYAALLPAVGAALVIGAGVDELQPRLGAGRILSMAPFRYVGDRSYAYYLWHWPVLVIAMQYAGHNLSVPVKLLLVFGAFVLSIVSYDLFENPIRRLRSQAPAGALLWPASAVTVVVVALITLAAIDGNGARLEGAAAAAVEPRALADPVSTAAAQANSKPLPEVVAAVKAARRGAPLPSPLTPALGKLLQDFYGFPAGCAPDTGETRSKVCRLGHANSAKTIVVIGDSHAQHWMPPILAMAEKDSWAVLPLVKSACAPASWLNYPAKPECPAWFKWAKTQAQSLRPDVTLVAGAWDAQHIPDAAAAAVASLTTAMKPFSSGVVIVGDPPPQSKQPVDCLLSRGATMRTCTSKATKTQLHGDVKISARARKDSVGFIDTRGWFCARTTVRKRGETLCPLVINRTVTRRDLGHITTSYGLELAAPFRGAFRRAIFGG